MVKRYIYSLDPGGATGTPVRFEADTEQAGNSSYSQMRINISGPVACVVRVQVTTYDNNTNTAGVIKVSGSPVFINNYQDYTLDGTGNASFLCRLEGDPSQSGTHIRVIFTIVSITDGQFGSPITRQEDKVFL